MKGALQIGGIRLLPYFARRAAENRVVIQGTRKEQELLRAELERRVYKSRDSKISTSTEVN